MPLLFTALLGVWCMVCVAWAGAPAPAPSGALSYGHKARHTALDCNATDPCDLALPGATRFDSVPGKPYMVGFDDAGNKLGWVVLSTDLGNIKGYSGNPISTLVGLDPNGVIAGGRVVHHSEPILLLGIPEQRLHDFVDQYKGVKADETVVVGKASGNQRAVDIVSGATVTALAENRTILESARELGQDVGVIKRVVQVPGHFVIDDGPPWTWAELEDRHALGYLTVTPKQMDVNGKGYEDSVGGDQAFIDLVFAVADPPQIGRTLLGDGIYRYAMSKLQPGEHLLVILGNGKSSFKGSGFVRGGAFDRVRVEQGLSVLTFRDLDYTNISGPDVADAPDFKEGALFVTRDNQLDPGRPFDLVFLGSRFDGKGGYSREFHTFSQTFRIPKAIYKLDGPDPEQAIWRQAWRNDTVQVSIVIAWLLTLIGLFSSRRWLTGNMKRLRRIHIGMMGFSFVVGGLILGAQPSVTQLLTFISSVVHEWHWGLFLTEPLLFVSWIFIAVVSLIWGRGVFCGWACPYGSMSELLYKLGRALKIPEFEIPDPIHRKLRLVRYAVLIGLIVVYLKDPILGEQAAEIEPFKSTFFVAFWTRQWYFAGWWLILFVLSFLTYRPFCQYICPLGAGLAVPGSLRISGPHRREFCSKCKICARGCEPRAIRPDGTIDPRDCLSCMECEANWGDDKVCPPLVKLRRDLEKRGQARRVKPREIK
ncbi:MAG: 4Fe-4S binding protein [Oligoflexia bacterium]|nr:4Fe-4S binding protein [Oligoflexia bacterium]